MQEVGAEQRGTCFVGLETGETGQRSSQSLQLQMWSTGMALALLPHSDSTFPRGSEGWVPWWWSHSQSCRTSCLCPSDLACLWVGVGGLLHNLEWGNAAGFLKCQQNWRGSAKHCDMGRGEKYATNF